VRLYTIIHTDVLFHCRWKVHESCLLALGSVSKLFVEHLERKKCPLDINAFLEETVLADLNLNGALHILHIYIIDIYIFSILTY